jgi:hypothetical protein
LSRTTKRLAPTQLCPQLSTRPATHRGMPYAAREPRVAHLMRRAQHARRRAETALPAVKGALTPAVYSGTCAAPTRPPPHHTRHAHRESIACSDLVIARRSTFTRTRMGWSRLRSKGGLAPATQAFTARSRSASCKIR